MQRLRQDMSYVSQGFIVSLAMLSVVLLLVAAIALVLLALMPGSLGIMLRELFPPGEFMAQLALGGVALFIMLWGLSYIHYLPRRLSLRLRWLIGLALPMAMVTATIFISGASG
ncbi:hypothetical protein [Vacuolonema iberomarrocanum]|uniref:hypothetical protein n=1 Tax=Vacuolonema iberomarrocanum TaxID=3454632 RepID=UPI001A0B13A6|nr:hypothetical protein [filamentous cyanobacterium LEGE 07170]